MRVEREIGEQKVVWSWKWGNEIWWEKQRNVKIDYYE